MIMKTHVFSIAFPLLFLLLSAGLCSKKPNTCHKSIKVVNESENTIYLGCLGYFPNIIGTEHLEDIGLFDCYEPIPSQDTVIVQVISRHCLEDYDAPMSFYVLPTPPSGIITTSDSLYIVYDILKIIDLQELGIDSLVKTDYTVYYP